jgi:hypothetical protein
MLILVTIPIYIAIFGDFSSSVHSRTRNKIVIFTATRLELSASSICHLWYLSFRWRACQQSPQQTGHSAQEKAAAAENLDRLDQSGPERPGVHHPRGY